MRARYTCVLYTDTDEFIVPDPKRYPGGLKQYFASFAADTSLQTRRTNGMELAHISYGNGSFSFDNVKNASALSSAQMQEIWKEHGYIEAPMNWSRPILSQRRYWINVFKYSKPLLTKIPIRYRPGFHNNFVGPMVLMDPDLVLIHMKSSDYEFCTVHEEAKYQTTLRMHPLETLAGFNDHIRSSHGHACDYSAGCYSGPWLGEKTAVFDNSGTVRLNMMDEAWNKTAF